MVKIKKNTIFAIYQPYSIRHISLQHGWVDRYYGPPCSPAYIIAHCSCRILATFTNNPQFTVKIKKNTLFAIYRPYWICHISLQHGWVDRYYGPPCSPIYVISYCSYRILATSTNSPQFMVKVKKDTVFFSFIGHIGSAIFHCNIGIMFGHVNHIQQNLTIIHQLLQKVDKIQ